MPCNTMASSGSVTLIDELSGLAALPQGIELIRGSILQAALSGRLTSASPNGHLILDDLDFPQSTADSGAGNLSPWSIPNDWNWVRLGTVSASVLGKMLDKVKNRGELRPYLRNTNVRWHSFDLTDLKQMRFETGEDVRYGLLPGDVVVCEGGEPGRAAVWELNETALIQKALHRVRCEASLNPYWLTYVLDGISRSGFLAQYFTGIGIKHLTGVNLKRIQIPLPPRAEQDRLVYHLRKLFSAVDELGDRLAEAERYRSVLVANAFEQLGLGTDNLALVLLNELIRNIDDVSQLECSVIELAVRGKLVPQARARVTVDSLLQSAQLDALDKAQLAHDEVRAVEEPYAAPEGWRWVPLGAVLQEIQAGWSPKAQPRPKEEDEWGVLKVSACSWGEFRAFENKALQPDQAPRSNLEVKPGDFLISRANTSELVGRSVVVDATPSHLMLSDKTLRLSVVDGCNPRYLNLANLAQAARRHYKTEATGTSSSMKNVSQKAIRRTPIPLPPPSEQDQIMGVVDKLMVLIRTLRFQLVS